MSFLVLTDFAGRSRPRNSVTVIHHIFRRRQTGGPNQPSATSAAPPRAPLPADLEQTEAEEQTVPDIDEQQPSINVDDEDAGQDTDAALAAASPGDATNGRSDGQIPGARVGSLQDATGDDSPETG